MCYHNGRKALSKEAAVMRIPVLVEPDYRNSLWARQTLEGIAREAARKKYELALLDAAQEERHRLGRALRRRAASGGADGHVHELGPWQRRRGWARWALPACSSA